MTQKNTKKLLIESLKDNVLTFAIFTGVIIGEFVDDKKCNIFHKLFYFRSYSWSGPEEQHRQAME